jgi:predicted kinase
MHAKTLVLSRGLPGSGKSTLARALTKYAFAADDYFERGGGYDFDPAKLPEAHRWCMDRTRDAMAAGESVVAVHNTFSQCWEAAPYFEMAHDYGYTVFVVEAQSTFGNVHGVPEAVIDNMRLRWESLTRAPLPWWKVLQHHLGRILRWRGTRN